MCERRGVEVDSRTSCRVAKSSWKWSIHNFFFFFFFFFALFCSQAWEGLLTKKQEILSKRPKTSWKGRKMHKFWPKKQEFLLYPENSHACVPEGERLTSCHHVKRGYTAQILKGAFGDDNIRWKRTLGEKWDCTPKKWIFQWQNFKPFVFFHKFRGKFVKIFLFLIIFFSCRFWLKTPKIPGLWMTALF